MDAMHEIRKQTAAARGNMRRAWAADSEEERAKKLREADQQLGAVLRMMCAAIGDTDH